MTQNANSIWSVSNFEAEKADMTSEHKTFYKLALQEIQLALSEAKEDKRWKEELVNQFFKSLEGEVFYDPFHSQMFWADNLEPLEEGIDFWFLQFAEKLNTQVVISIPESSVKRARNRWCRQPQNQGHWFTKKMDQISADYPEDMELRGLTKWLLGVDGELEEKMFLNFCRAALVMQLEPQKMVGWKRMLVLVSGTDQRKSTFVKTLSNLENRHYNIPTRLAGEVKYHYDLKDMGRYMVGKWLMEWSEIDKTLHGRSAALVKDLISESLYSWIPKYVEEARTELRRTLFIGTTNTTDGLFTDPTLASRLWVIRIPDGHAIPNDEFIKVVKKFWATLYREYKAAKVGQWSDWVPNFDSNLVKPASELAMEYAEQSDDVGDIALLLKPLEKAGVLPDGLIAVRMTDWLKALGIQNNRSNQIRIAYALRELGWVKKTMRSPIARTQFWLNREPGGDSPEFLVWGDRQKLETYQED